MYNTLTANFADTDTSAEFQRFKEDDDIEVLGAVKNLWFGMQYTKYHLHFYPTKYISPAKMKYQI